MNNGTSSSSSDYETTPKFKKSFGKNINAKFDVFMKTRCDLIIEADNKIFKNRTQKPTILLCSFQELLNSKFWTDYLFSILSVKWIALIILKSTIF